MAYSGARVNEITQLRKEDIYEEDGIEVMRLTPDAGTIKSGCSGSCRCTAPPETQGFLEWREKARRPPLLRSLEET